MINELDYNRIEKILYKYYKNEINSNNKLIILDYDIIDQYYPKLAEMLHDNYKAITKTLELHIKKMRIQQIDTRIKFKNVKPIVQLDKIHQRYNSKWISFEGIVKKRSTVFNKITHVHWTCKVCGHDYVYRLGYGEKLNPPRDNCKNCRNKTGYVLNRKESKYEDIQLFILEEDQKSTNSVFQPTQLKCYLKNDMINTIKPGDKIQANGIVELENNGKYNQFQEYVTIKSIEKLEKDFEDLLISSEDEKKIIKLSKEKDIYDKIIRSIIPSIYGYDELKMALALHLFSSPNNNTSDGSYKRGDIHILIVGDPSMGKSQILKYVSKLAPHGIYTSGKGSSGAGLTATTVKDEFGSWSLEAGAMVLANNGNICIDEFDKMKDDDRSAIHEALEQQTISISKAGINTTLNCRCSVVAAANPKYGRFDVYKNIGEQLNLSPAILSRFDLIFILTDVIDKEKDTKIAMKILNDMENDDENDFIDEKLLRKYISYARKINPKIDWENTEYIANFFSKSRTLAEENNHPIPITTRQLEAISRLAKASARIRLSDKVNLEDTKRAIELQKYCMKLVGFDSNSMSVEADKVIGNMSQEERKKMDSIEKIVKELSEKWNSIPEHILTKEVKSRGFDVETLNKWIKVNLDKELFFDEISRTYTLR